MMDLATDSRIQRRLLDTLYVEAMVLADEARGYFDQGGRVDREALDPMTRVAFSCESLKVTTRLMHVIAWLLTQRAVEAGEMAPREALDPVRRLGEGPHSDEATLALMPMVARSLIESSMALHRRVAVLDGSQQSSEPPQSPARSLRERIAAAF